MRARALAPVLLSGGQRSARIFFLVRFPPPRRSLLLSPSHPPYVVLASPPGRRRRAFLVAPRLAYAPRRSQAAEVAIARGRGATVRCEAAKRGHRLAPPLAGARSSLPSAYSIRRSFSSLRLRGAECAVCASAPASPKVRAPPRSPSSLYPRADRPRSFRPGAPTQKEAPGPRARAARKGTREKEPICLKVYLEKKRKITHARTKGTFLLSFSLSFFR